MNADLIYRVGETKRISHLVSADTAFAITGAVITIYESDGNVEVNGASASYTSGSSTEHEVYYNWAPAEADDYTYLLRYTVGSENVSIRGRVLVLPVTSKFDRYVDRCSDWLNETSMGEAQRELSYRDWMKALGSALEVYSRDVPRIQFNDPAGVTLTTAWEYDLPADWVAHCSEILEFEYPVDDTQQAKSYLDPEEYVVDHLRDKWRFAWITPAAGEKARYTYTTPHVLSHTADSVHANHFHAVCQYAAGAALLALANRWSSETLPEIAADVAGIRDKQLKYRQQAAEMMKAGRAAWGGGVDMPRGTTARMFYLPWHGRVIE